jgi:hypothetical protein
VDAASKLIEVAAAVGATSLTLSRSKLFLPARFWVMRKSRWWGDLVTCWYCLAHWLSLAAAFALGPLELSGSYLINCFITAMTLVALSAPFVAVIVLAMKQLGPHLQPDEGATNENP